MITRRLHRAARRLHVDDDGATLLVVVMLLPMLILAGSMAIDTANWFVHKRHLQTQADAGALAAAQNFQFPCSTAVKTAITNAAHQYDGTGAGSPYNAQVNSKAGSANATVSSSTTGNNIISVLNRPNFAYGQSKPNDTDLSGSASADGDFCADNAIDVKVSEHNTPWFFKALGFGFNINAQARVSIQGQATGEGQLPLGVPNPAPNFVHATYFDEATGTVLGQADLTPSTDHQTWTSSAPTTVNYTAANSGQVGVKVALAGTSTTTCGGDLVACYPATGSPPDTTVDPTNGLLFIQTFTTAGTPGQPTAAPIGPIVRSAQLVGAGATPCADPYFNASTASCGVQLQAKVDFASGLTCSQTSVTLKVGATSSTGTATTMTCPGTSSSPATATWTSAVVTVAPDSGPKGFFLTDWTQTGNTTKPVDTGVTGGDNSGKCTNGKPCAGPFASSTNPKYLVQRTYAGASSRATQASSGTGPISSATLADASGTAYSAQRCASGCSHSLVLTLTVRGFQNETTIASPPSSTAVLLRLKGQQGNQALDCGQGPSKPQFTAVIANGCHNGPYATTTIDASACPTTAVIPVVCVSSVPGNAGSGKPVEPGLDQRVNGGSTCVNRNHWTSPNTVDQLLTAQPPDPRIVKLFIFDSGSFDGVSGHSTNFPIRAFATFYLTGWSGSPCNTANSSPASGLPYAADDNAGLNPGEVKGHFVKFVEPGGGGSGTGAPCSAVGTIGNCVAVLTK